MDKKQLLDCIKFLLNNKVIDNNVYQAILNGIDKIKFENSISYLDANKQIEEAVSKVVGVGLRQKVNNLNISE